MRFSIILILVGIAGFLYGQDTLTYTLDDTIVVTGSRIPTKLHETTRSIYLITHKEVNQHAIQDMDDILHYSPVDVQERGMGNVQADLSIRGSKAGQVLVLWDGMDISDPQTGHFFANIPAPFHAVQKVELVTGGSSSMYGAQAFGGVINFIPLSLQGTRYGFHSYMGSFSTLQNGGYLSLDKGPIRFSNFVDFQQSDGYRKNTDFKVWNSFHMVDYKGENSFHRLGFGMQQKDFGAQDFYAPYESWESNKAYFIYLKNKIDVSSNVALEINGLWRKHMDKYVLFRDDPGYYTNNHRTEKYLMDASVFYDYSKNWTLVAGASYGEDYIYSKGLRRGEVKDSAGQVISTYPIEIWALGKHRRVNKAVFAESRHRFDRWLINFGFRLDYNTFYQYDYSPALDMAYFITGKWKIRASFSRAFRAPDYTELFYVSPYNVGNPDLTSEKANNYELGMDYYSNTIQFQTTVFLSDEKNVIDWVPEKDDVSGNTVYHARNFNHLKNKGIEIQGHYNLGTLNVHGFYQRLEIQDVRTDSKYIYNYSKNLFKLWANVEPSQWLSLGTSMRYVERMNGNVFAVMDSRMDLLLKKVKLSLGIHNLLNRKYENIPGVEAPGRWLSLGISYNH